MNKSPTLTFFYRNWKGKKSYRTVSGDIVIWFGKSVYHDGQQWFMKAYDIHKKDIRDFAFVDIIEFVGDLNA